MDWDLGSGHHDEKEQTLSHSFPTQTKQVQERQQTTTTTTTSSRTPQPGQSLLEQQPEECRVVLEGEEDELLPASFFATLPWSRSITGEGKEALLYMPFVEEQLKHLREMEGGDVRVLPTPPTVAYQRSERKAAHMGKSMCAVRELDD